MVAYGSKGELPFTGFSRMPAGEWGWGVIADAGAEASQSLDAPVRSDSDLGLHGPTPPRHGKGINSTSTTPSGMEEAGGAALRRGRGFGLAHYGAAPKLLRTLRLHAGQFLYSGMLRSYSGIAKDLAGEWAYRWPRAIYRSRRPPPKLLRNAPKLLRNAPKAYESE